MPMAVFRGSTSECLAHLFSDANEDVRPILAAFTGVTLTSVQRWKAKARRPQGPIEAKVREFLTERGYEVTETPQGVIPQTAQPAARVTNGSGNTEKSAMLVSTAHAVQALIPLADYLLSDSCSEEDRKKLHEIAGANSVLRLTTRLRRLCSETARKQLKDI